MNKILNSSWVAFKNYTKMLNVKKISWCIELQLVKKIIKFWNVKNNQLYIWIKVDNFGAFLDLWHGKNWIIIQSFLSLILLPLTFLWTINKIKWNGKYGRIIWLCYERAWPYLFRERYLHGRKSAVVTPRIWAVYLDFLLWTGYRDTLLRCLFIRKYV